MTRIIVLLAALALSACGGMSARPVSAGAAAAPAGIAAQAEGLILSGERGFAAAEVVYTAAAHTASALARSGVIRGARATRLRRLNTDARQLLVEGKATTDGARQAAAAARLFGIADELAQMEN